MNASNEHLPTAWLYTRGEASVHIEVTQRRGTLHVTMSGPGHAVASYTFPDRASLLAFADTQQRELIEQGFQLQAVAERRGSDRPPRRGASYRRRGDSST